ncbi:DNA-3-methyladenine glycosylase I [Brachybacterium saurashtrense]|uniref:DNA-3-methyladenine glycosylase I n=1 Tax=Brachybacterium saurashtrense TaxID=556288 RepID=A0A345YMU7_9MICO|nr:DNA-3-methyladenine glycosylase I [Brachybacterium saurashtrense]AXK45249.1 DNA-3-methyladenine glycosylase I [Brachybacterium saurashtrense]RRR21996.1 DNA-3-methyladenine glycosylase I [Brachybacterium saurashtrense]
MSTQQSTPPADGLVRGDDGLVRPVWASVHDDLRRYYDTEWGMPVRDERGVFERLALEGFQSGLSWATILRRREGFRRAFAGFDVETVARFGAGEVERLLEDTSIIRHRGKIEATLGNARAALALRDERGPGTTLADLVWSYRPERTPGPRTAAEVPTQSAESVALAKELKRRGFRFVGPTTMFALMEAIGIVDTHLLDSHRRGTSGVWNEDGTPAPGGAQGHTPS